MFIDSGNASIEGAIDWIAEHENDPDIDQMLLVSDFFFFFFCFSDFI